MTMTITLLCCGLFLAQLIFILATCQSAKKEWTHKTGSGPERPEDTGEDTEATASPVVIFSAHTPSTTPMSNPSRTGSRLGLLLSIQRSIKRI